MKNLAGDQHCDEVIEDELSRAQIVIDEHDHVMLGEVPAKLTGFLTKGSRKVFRFQRAWYYWVVSGDVPLAVAEVLYSNPVGKRDVRVGGHCDCPAPVTPWVKTKRGAVVVEVYHIDSQRGLNLFVDTLRRYGLAD